MAKKLVVLNKNWITGYFSIPWTNQQPFLAPFEVPDVKLSYVAYAEWCGDNSARNVKVNGVNSYSMPPDYISAIGQTFSFTLPGSWEQEGFVLGNILIFVAQSSSDWAYLQGQILAISGNSATIELQNVINYNGNPQVETEEDSICFFQELTPVFEPQAMIVREGEEASFTSALNPNTSAFSANPDRGALTMWGVDAAAGYAPTLPFWVQDSYGLQPSWPAIDTFTAEFKCGNFWAIQDGYDLDEEINQNYYFTNELRLLFGIRSDFFTDFKIRTAHVNCTEAGTPTGGSVVLSGTNGNWVVNVTPPPGAALAGVWVALTNEEAAHQGGSADNLQLLQPSPMQFSLSANFTHSFTFVPPAAAALAIAVFSMPSGGYGVKVSNRISLVPPISPDVLISPINEFDEKYFSNADKKAPLYPWDAIGFLASYLPSLPAGIQHPFISVRWWSYVKHLSGQTWMLEDAECNIPPSFPSIPHHEVDATVLRHFVNLPVNWDINNFWQTNIDGVLMLSGVEAGGLFLRTYAAVYLLNSISSFTPLAPVVGTNQGFEIRLALLAETISGTHYAECVVDSEIINYTAYGTWVTDTQWEFNAPIVVPAGQVAHVHYRLAIFEGEEISKTPIWQEDNNTPGANYIAPVVGPAVINSIQFNFPPQNDPGTYTNFVRATVYLTASNLVQDSPYFFSEAHKYKIKRQFAFITGRDICPPCVPALQNETIQLLYPTQPAGLFTTPAVDWWQYGGPPLCELPPPYCGYTIVNEIPAHYIDILCIFDNYVLDDIVVGVLLIRAPGVARRVDDAVVVETYVNKTLKEDDILRAFKRRYEVELFISNPCILNQLEIAKFSKRVNLTIRQGLLNSVNNLVIEDYAIRDVGPAQIVRIALREEAWRQEFRLV